MRTLKEHAWKYVETILCTKKVWVCSSPWSAKVYAEKLFNLSKEGVEVP